MLIDHKDRKILDHGYVKLVTAWGSDAQIVEAARMSTSKGFLGWGPKITDEPCPKCNGIGRTDDRGFALSGQPHFSAVVCEACEGDLFARKPGDEKLLRHLWEHKHATPFEMAGMIIEVQAPIFVFREWHRHRTQSYNEMSARYIPLPDVNYEPTVERLLLNQKIAAEKGNKQAGTIKGSEELTERGAMEFQYQLQNAYDHAQELYQKALRAGVPKELARAPIPVGRYSRMRASANLRNWLAFMTLRQAPEAQWEIRQYANIVSDMIADHFPRTHALYLEGQELDQLIAKLRARKGTKGLIGLLSAMVDDA